MASDESGGSPAFLAKAAILSRHPLDAPPQGIERPCHPGDHRRRRQGGARVPSTDTVFTPDPKTSTIPLYWYRPLAPLSASAGMHRFTWDVHYQPLPSNASGQAVPPMIGGPNLPIAAIGHNTIATPTTPWVNPASSR